MGRDSEPESCHCVLSGTTDLGRLGATLRIEVSVDALGRACSVSEQSLLRCYNGFYRQASSGIRSATRESFSSGKDILFAN